MPSLFGWSAYIYQGDISGVPEGSAVIAKRDLAEYQPGEAVIFADPERQSGNRMVVWFVSEKLEDGSYRVFDATGENEKTVAGGDIRGKAMSYVVFLGKALAFAQQPYGIYASAGFCLLFATLLLVMVVRCRGRGYQETKNYLDYVPAEEDKESERPPKVRRREKGLEPPSLVIDQRYSQKEPERAALLTGDVGGRVVQIQISGSDEEVQLLSRLVDMAIKKRGSEKAIMDIAYGEKAQLSLRCGWQDVGVLATLVMELQKRAEQAAQAEQATQKEEEQGTDGDD